MTVIAILAFLQLAVLIVLHVFVATRFAVSTIYQIAFVLETHFTLVAGRLLVSFILQFNRRSCTKVRNSLFLIQA